MIPQFLTIDEVMDLYEDAMARYGGTHGVRDIGLLESALAQPTAMFDGVFLHEDLFEMAAAYLFHLVSNHPFADGNKRIGLLAALAFLGLNGLTITGHTDHLYNLTMTVAQGRLVKSEIAAALREIVDPNSLN